MTRTELNKAIGIVITAQYKKDYREAFKMVEEAGYVIDKWNGSFGVTNTATHRTVKINFDKYHARLMLNPYKYGQRVDDNWELLQKVDFVGCLEKEINKVWQQAQCYEYVSPTMEKYKRIKSVRSSIRYNASEVIRIKKKMEELQKSLEYYQKGYQESREELVAVKARFGMKV